ncbi:transcriptional regulator [Streptomyces capoamus]|uniref:Transcriptional regulator n=1 Tax=Streptomyces capoamus TaxID=68183 RepID=A0A919C8I3_9ACTN|nr:transcriptional regulator [Streptomyces libani subsp. rufus]GHG54106.1 transcriptional regulator [Streptomyces capoamus]
MLRWSATVLAVVILGTAGAGYLYYQHLNSNIRKGERAGGDDSKAQRTAPNAAGQTPLNILLIGSDSRNSKENLKLGGSRDHVGDPPLADVQMLIHLSADRKSAAMVSIPRDTRVHIPECKDPDGKDYPPTDDIINVTLARGGAGCTLLTWEELTGVYIDHWMTIDFAGVVRMADAIGGVEVCVNQNVWDHSTPSQRGGSGLKLTKGSHKVKGEQALQWLRTRHAWGSDLMRARAQHMYLNSMIRTLKKQNVFTDTGRLMDLAEAATKSLQVSEEIGTVKKLYDLGMEMKSVPTDRITSVTMPNVPDPNDPDNHVVPDRSKADKVWQMLKDDVPFDKNGGKSGGKKDGAKKDGGKDGSARTPSLDAARLGVLVQNATRTSAEAAVPQRASAIGQVLVRKGYARAQADTSGSLAEDRTVVRYPSADLEGDAQAVAEALGIPMSQVQKSTEVSGVTVVVGADWRTGTAYPKESVPKAGDLPEGTDAANASDKPTCMDVYKPYQWR